MSNVIRFEYEPVRSVREQLLASHDLLNLYGDLADAASHIKAASATVFACHQLGDVPTTRAIESARDAAHKVLAACDTFDPPPVLTSDALGG